MKNLFITISLAILLISCSGISGEYRKVNIGYLGMNNSVSGYDFSSFGSVKYFLSTSGTNSTNSYNKMEGKYKVEGDKVVLNFGGNDKFLYSNSDKTELTDERGDVYKK
jgi:hypothetical protein